jgi:N utilization substance protein B
MTSAAKTATAAKSAKSRNKGSAKARRSAARLAAVQALYQIEIAQGQAGQPGVEAVLGEFVKHRFGQDQDGDTFVSPEPVLFADIVRGVAARQADFDHILDSALGTHGSVARMELLLRAILRSAVFELSAHGETAPRIVINDYINVTHAFFAGREPGMVNGILDRVGRVLRPEEFSERTAVAEQGDGEPEAG